MFKSTVFEQTSCCVLGQAALAQLVVALTACAARVRVRIWQNPESGLALSAATAPFFIITCHNSPELKDETTEIECRERSLAIVQD